MTDAPAPRRALVTGGAVRVGRSISLALGRAGWDVAVHFHDSAAEAEEVVGEVTDMGGRGAAVSADLRVPARIPDLFDRVTRELGGLDLLVNNAASFPGGRPEDVSARAWDDVFALNARAPFFCSVEAARAMRGGGGCIVNVADVAAFEAWPSHVPYAATKAALVSLTRSLAAAWAPGIRVTGVAPGPVLLPETATKEDRLNAEASTLVERPGEADDVAEAVLYLADADFITGEVIRVDGGESVARITRR